MAETLSTSHWRDEPIVPKDYENIAGLVRVARKARDRIVEFDWFFKREDLLCLRRAVYEWGSPVVGRYRCFDARVLAAINEAIGETNTTFVLEEPARSRRMDSRVSCVGDGDSYRLQGHASFDVIFGYGSAGVAPNLTGGVHLSAAARTTLASSVGMLGWDLRRLQEEQSRPVRNAIYGLPLDYGHKSVESTRGPKLSVSVHFHGPYSVLDEGDGRCLFKENEIANRSGVYLWTVTVGGEERPWYVGQTRRTFAERMAEHLAGFLSGEYLTYDPAALKMGRHVLANGAVKGMWPKTIPTILRNYESLAPKIIELIRLMKFHLAPLAGDAHLHNRVEGAIGRYYKAHPIAESRDFFGPGIKLPAAMPYDNPLHLILSSEMPLAGFPSEIREPQSSGDNGVVAVPLPDEVRHFVETAAWTFAKTYAATWPHEYIARTPENALMLLALARHIFEHGTEERFYSRVFKYHHEDGKVYWSMDPTPEATDLINRCDETQTYEARLAADTLPDKCLGDSRGSGLRISQT